MLLLAPSWSGVPRRPLLRDGLVVSAARFVPRGGWPRRIGALEPIGAVTLSSNQPGLGGFSALALYRDHALLLTDGGLLVRLRIADGTVQTLPGSSIEAGPETGWSRASRDTESLAVDAASGRMWIGYERINTIWSYTPEGRAAGSAAWPAAMRDWGLNTGIESLVRLRDGRFLALREGSMKRSGPRAALLFEGDPSFYDTPVARLRYLPPAGFAPSDAAPLPNGDVLVLNRRWRLPLRFDAVLVRLPAAGFRGGALLHGRVVARLGDILGGENVEGLAISRERGETMIWMITDNDGYAWRRTILAKFRWRDG